jgi:hypothetical protein
MVRLVALLCLLAVSCSPLPDIERGMNGLRGKPVDAAVAKLGRPQSQGVIRDETVYVWSTSYSDVGIIPTYASGTVGNTTATGAAYTIGPTGSTGCTLRVFAKAEVVTGWDVDGEQRACRRYAEDLR